MANNIAGITTLTGQLMTNMVRGYSAYEVAVQNGFEGTVEEWLESLVGESVQIEVLEDTASSYIIQFSVGDEVVVTPNLREDLSDMKTQVQNLQTLISSHGADIINLKATDVSLDERITALEEGGGGGEDPDLADRVSALETVTSVMDARLSTVEASVGGYDSAIEELNTEIAGINTEVGTLGSDVTNMKASVASMESDVSDLKADNVSNKARLSNIESSITNLNTAMTMFESRLSSVEEQIEELEDSVTKAIVAHDQAVDAHEDIRNQLSELSTKFDTYIDSTDIDLDQLSEIVAYIKNIKAVEIVDELPSEEDADPNKIYILRQTINQEEVGG